MSASPISRCYQIEDFLMNNIIEDISDILSDNNFSFDIDNNEFIFDEFNVKQSELVLFKTKVTDPNTPFYAEGFQMLCCYSGTFANPTCIARCPDNSSVYRITNDLGYTTVYNYIAYKSNNSWILVGFSTCNKFQGFFRVYPDGTLEAVMDTENFKGYSSLENLVIIEDTSLFAIKCKFAKYINNNLSIQIPNKTPTGWCSWYSYYADVNEQLVIQNLNELKNFDSLDYLLIDDGYQNHMGDWLDFSASKFSLGLEELVHKINNTGKKAAIWIAPFICSTESSIFKNHQDWLVKDKNGNPLCSSTVTYEGWREAPWYMLDFSNPEVCEYIYNVVTFFYKKLNITYFKLDALYWGAIKGSYFKYNQTRIQNYRKCLEIFRKATDNKAYILGCNAPMWPSIGLVHGMRCADDVERNKQRYTLNFHVLLHRLWMSRMLWHIDPDCICIKDITNQSCSPEIYNYHFSGMQLFTDIIMLGDPLSSYSEEDKLKIEKLILSAKTINIEEQSDDLKQVVFTTNDQKFRITFDLVNHSCDVVKI